MVYDRLNVFPHQLILLACLGIANIFRIQSNNLQKMAVNLKRLVKEDDYLRAVFQERVLKIANDIAHACGEELFDIKPVYEKSKVGMLYMCYCIMSTDIIDPNWYKAQHTQDTECMIYMRRRVQSELNGTGQYDYTVEPLVTELSTRILVHY